MADDYGNTTSTNGAAFVATPINGNIETAADEDWFKITLNAGVTYTFDLEGTDTSRGTLGDPKVRLLNSGGTQIASDDDSGVGYNSQLVYTPLTTGIYIISAQAYSSSATGTYRLLVSATGGPADDYSATTGTSGAVSVGAPANGNIESAGDVDWFRINLNAGQTYVFDLEGTDTSRGTLGDPRLQLLNSSGTSIASDDDSGAGYNSQITYTPTASGTYYLAAQAYSSTATGTYRVSASTTGPTDDYAANTGTAGSVNVGSGSTGAIETAGDIDWFRINLNAGQTYIFDLEGTDTGRGTLGDPRLQLLNSSGASLATDDDSGTGYNSQITFTPTTSGTYYLAAQAYSSTATGTYRVSASSAGPADDYAANSGTTGLVAVGSPATGAIESAGDVDWFRVNFVAGRTYVFDLEGADTGRGTLGDPRLQLINSAGTVVATDDDSGVGYNAQITFTAGSTGAHYLAVQAYSSTATGTYRLSVGSSTPGDDYAENNSTTGAVSVGGFATGNIETIGDGDWFRVTLTGGNTYQIDVEGVDTGRGTLADPWMEIYNSAGAYLAGDDVSDEAGIGHNAQIIFTPTTSGTYYIGAASDNDAGTGTYRVSVTPSTGGDDYASNSGTNGVVIVGNGPAIGSIETGGDIDWFRVTLAAGQTYQFDLEGVDTSRGTLADPRVQLVNSAGTTVATDDDSGVGYNSQLTYTAGSSGTYYVAAQSYSSTGTGTYQLVAAQVGGVANPTLQTAYLNIMRATPTGSEAAFLNTLASQVSAGTLTQAQANLQIVGHAINTTTVATLAYEFFTGRIPSQGGIDYLVSPTGPNPNNLNAPYYQNFNIENRYINFAVNLGKLGEGAASFNARYGALNLFDATRSAYQTIFGGTPTDAKLHALLDPTFVLNGQVMSRSDYFNYYGQDGLNGIGTKAAMVGWLMAEAAKADLGVYVKSNDAFLLDLADGANFSIDIVGVYGRPEYYYSG